MKYFLPVLATIIYVIFIVSFAKLYLADVYHAASATALAEKNYQDARKNSAQAIKLNPQEPAYYRGHAKALLTLAALADAKQSVKELKSAALLDLTTAYNLNTQNLATVRNAVPLYYFLAVKNFSLPAESSNVDQEFLPDVLTFYNTVKNISPNDVGMYVLFAKYEKKLGLIADYDYSVEKIRELRPDLLDWHENFK